MWRIARGLYLGDHRDAHDQQLLEGMGVTHILNCAREVARFYRRDFRYLHLKLADPDPNFKDHIEKLCRFIHRGRRTGGIMVNCRAGLSRCPSSILAYLYWRGNTLDHALDLPRNRVGESGPEFIEADVSFFGAA
jgi:hypothetical protein